MTKQNHIHYNEGQWFAVPLQEGGYALGIVVRGWYRTKGRLGYFFSPKYSDLPTDQDTWQKKSEDAIYITRFGDLGIIRGDWPLIHSTCPFSRSEWPIPKFGMKIELIPGKGFLREYVFTNEGKWILVNESVVNDKDLIGLPEDGGAGGGYIEAKLTRILDP